MVAHSRRVLKLVAKAKAKRKTLGKVLNNIECITIELERAEYSPRFTKQLRDCITAYTPTVEPFSILPSPPSKKQLITAALKYRKAMIKYSDQINRDLQIILHKLRRDLL